MLRALLLALSLILLAAASAPGASVTIAPSGGGAARSLSLDALAGSFDVHGAAYTVRAADGSTSMVTVADGISLNALLAAAGLDGDGFDYIALDKADGSTAIVMRDDLGGTDQGPPVVWSDEQGIHFLRPADGNGDANDADRVDLAAGTALTIALRRGQPLVPRIVASARRVRPGERVVFRAALAGGGSLRPGLGFQWYFDGPHVDGPTASHRFAPGGPYLVLLNIVRGTTTIGNPATLTIHVASARERHADEAHPAGDAGATGVSTGSSTSGGGGAGYGAATATRPTATASPAASPSLSAPRPAPVRPRTPPGKLVSGTLLASASAVAASPDAGAAGRTAAMAAAHRAAADGPLHVPVGVWVGIGLAVLLALGWALESRHTLPFWQP